MDEVIRAKISYLRASIAIKAVVAFVTPFSSSVPKTSQLCLSIRSAK